MQPLRRINHQLFPTSENNYVPHILRVWPILLIFFVGIGLFSFARLSQLTGSFGTLAQVYPSVVVTLTNTDRVKQSLQALSVNGKLTKAAQLKADDMAKNGYFAHTSPSGITPWHWFGSVGYSFVYAGENLAVNFDDSQTVQTAWLNSPTHRANILNGNFTEIGVAVAKGLYNGRETTFVVEMFGAPAAGRSFVPAGAPPVKVVNSNVAVQDTTITKFAMLKNTDPSAQVAGERRSDTTPPLRWYTRALLVADTLASAVIMILLILLFLATASLVARSYEKHHLRHMLYGGIVMVLLFSSLFVGDWGIMNNRNKLVYETVFSHSRK